jgi:hypothetical protein
MSVLPDGSHDVLVVDAQSDVDDAVHFELAIVAGPHKGDVVMLRATGMTRDAIDMLGLPATLIVEEGRPRILFDDAL